MFICSTCGAKTNYAQCQYCWTSRRVDVMVAEAEACVVSTVEGQIVLSEDDRAWLASLGICDGGS